MSAKTGFRTPQNRYDVLYKNQKKYLDGIENGDFVPFTYPMFTFGALVLLLYFLTPQLHSRVGRYAAFALSAAWHVYLIRNCRAWGPSMGYGIGIVSAWGILWAAVLLVFNDAVKDWKRVKREVIVNKGRPEQGATAAVAAGIVSQDSADAVLQRRSGKLDAMLVPREITTTESILYKWQAYPMSPFSERLEWCLDLLTNFRGIGWSWKASGMPSRSSAVEAALNPAVGDGVKAEDIHVTRSGVKRYDDFRALILHNAWLALKGYLTIDLIKTMMSHDPYFWGLVDQPAPAYLPTVIRHSALLTRLYRLLASMTIMWIGLRSVYTIAPLVFVGAMGPDLLGSNGEAWMYPDHYGSYSSVFDRGLAGWWGTWWHQVFRFAFQEGGRWLSEDVLGMKQKSFARTMVQTLAAFSISGLLHASGSSTMLGDTKPWRNAFLFFLLQPVGLLIEMGWRGMLRRAGVTNAIPRWLARACNFTYVHVWFAMTAPLFTDDFARGGIWHWEPLVFSPHRGLGFGAEGDGFYCWGGGRLAAWHTDRAKWWRSGISF